MADTASTQGRTEITVIQRGYWRPDTVLPQWINIGIQRLQHRLEAIWVTHFLPEPMRFRLALKKLQRAKSNIYYLYERRRDEYRDLNVDAEQLTDLGDNEVYELCGIDEKIHQLYSRHIIARAERYLLPTPGLQDPHGEWEIGRITNGFCLRREAMSALLSAIRVEKAQRRQAAQASLIWIAASIGVLGATTGLIAVLTH